MLKDELGNCSEPIFYKYKKELLSSTTE